VSPCVNRCNLGGGLNRNAGKCLHFADVKNVTAPSRMRAASVVMLGKPRRRQNRGNVDEWPSEVDAEWRVGKVSAPRRGTVGAYKAEVNSQGRLLRGVKQQQLNVLRVFGGSAKGRKIRSPEVYHRPMMGKVREALFSMLNDFDVLRSERSALDLYAGSGSVCIEALSRGMGSAVFVDYSTESAAVIDENLQSCGFGTRGRSLCASVEDVLANPSMFGVDRHVDLITVTPPYEEVDYGELVTSIAQSDCVGEGTFVVVEYPVELRTLPPVIMNRLIGMRNRRYGRTVIAIYACQPNRDLEPRHDEFIDLK